MARAFDILPGRSQVAVWHRQVEREDSADIERLLGGGTEAVSQLMKRSMQDLFNSYIQIHQEAMVSDAVQSLPPDAARLCGEEVPEHHT